MPASKCLIHCLNLYEVASAEQERTSPSTRARKLTIFELFEQVIAANLGALYNEIEIIEAHPFHVVRDADIEIEELEATTARNDGASAAPVRRCR